MRQAGRFSQGAGRTALGALLSGLELMLLYGASLLPTGQIGLTALAGTANAVAVIAGGWRTGFFCYGATGLLSLLLLPSKWVAAMYLACFGLYPMIKSLAERTGRKVVSFLVKLAFANAALAALYFLFGALFLEAAILPRAWEGIAFLSAPPVLLGLYHVLFLCYDLAFSGLIGFYAGRFGKNII